jgi:hypothetical protein
MAFGVREVVGDGEEFSPPLNGEPDPFGVDDAVLPPLRGEGDPSGTGEGVCAIDGDASAVGDSPLVGEGDALPNGEGVGVAAGDGISGSTRTRLFPLAAMAPVGRLPAAPISTKTG